MGEFILQIGKKLIELIEFNSSGLQYAMISMKVILSGLFRRFKYTTNLKLNELVMRFELTLKLDNKHMVEITNRDW